MPPFDGGRTAAPELGRAALAPPEAAPPTSRINGAALFAGPAIVAATAYIDPGNIAVNVEAGARFGYRLLGVVLAANLAAMLLQALSAKLGIASGRSLPELCRAHFPAPVAWALWAVAELAAMATDLAELLGGAIGFALLLGLPPLAGMTLTAAASCALLAFDRRGARGLEIAIAGFVAAVGACYLAELAIVPVDWHEAAGGLAPPPLAAPGAPALVAAILGAMVMPHALHLHSALARDRAARATPRERWRRVRWSDREVVFALTLAGAINLAMVALAAATFGGHAASASIAGAYQMLGPIFGAAAAALFVAALLAASIAGAAVGTLSGQIVMQGFLGFAVPLWLRRAATMLPAFVVIALGLDPTRALVMSQIVLSLALPATLVPLVWFVRRSDIMGPLACRGLSDAAALAATGLVLLVDLVLLATVLG